MMDVSEKHISQTRRRDLKQNFQDKVDELRRIVKTRAWSFGPPCPSFLSFCKWTSVAPQLRSISHSAVYKPNDDYERLRLEADGLLKRLKKGRQGEKQPGRKTLDSLGKDLAHAELTGQSYLDQLTMVRAELETMRGEVKRFRGSPGSTQRAGKTVVYLKKPRRQSSRQSPK